MQKKITQKGTRKLMTKFTNNNIYHWRKNIFPAGFVDLFIGKNFENRTCCAKQNQSVHKLTSQLTYCPWLISGACTIFQLEFTEFVPEHQRIRNATIATARFAKGRGVTFTNPFLPHPPGSITVTSSSLRRLGVRANDVERRRRASSILTPFVNLHW